MRIKPSYITGAQWVVRIFLGGLLIFAGVLKVIDNTALFQTIAYISWLPIWMKWQIVEFLPWLEILTGALLLIKVADKVALPLTTLFYMMFFVFAIYGFATGMEGDCGCFGDAASSTFGWGMIIRNGIFVLLTGFLLYKPKRLPDTELA